MSRDLPEDERELVELAASCDDIAFCALLERFGGLLSHVVSRSTSDPEVREDLQSEIIARLLSRRKKALRDWRPTASFGAYLAAIGSRHCHTWARRNGRIESVGAHSLRANTSHMPSNLLDQVVPGSDAPDPESSLSRKERAAVLRRAMGALSDADRLVLKLRFADDLSGPAIAEMLGVSHVAARQRIFRALRRLERVLAETAGDYFE